MLVQATQLLVDRQPQQQRVQVGKSIAEVVERCEITIAMVSDPAAAKQVANEVAKSMKKGALSLLLGLAFLSSARHRLGDRGGDSK